jgi:hypothetical protein
MYRYILIPSLLLILLLSACAGSTPPINETALVVGATETTAASAPEPTETPRPIPMETKAAPQTGISFEAATYRGESAGFELDYPAAWSLPDQVEQGSRGSIVQISESGEPRLDIVVLRWDPTSDLNAFIDVRKQAWNASGINILSQEELKLAKGHRAVRFVVQGQDGEQAFFFFTTVGERYLQLSGSGNLDLLAEIAQTVRLLQFESQARGPVSLDCSTLESGTVEGVACNLIDGIRSRNLSALHGYMTDPFTIGYWGSEGRLASPQETTTELSEHLLPADPSMPMEFTADRSVFPPLGGQQLEGLFGPDVNVAMVIYSEGWGTQGAGSALLFIAQDDGGGYYWHGMVYSEGHFDK